jgi:folate-binding protein YgfZ
MAIEDVTEAATVHYRALREDAMRLELPWLGTLRLAGPDTRSFLQGLATQDLARTDPGRGHTTLFATEKGRPVALAWVGFEGDEVAWIVADEVERGGLLAHFERFRIMEEVAFEPMHGPVQAFGGPERDRLLLEAAASAAGARPLASSPISFLAGSNPYVVPTPSASPAAVEAWRLAVGVPRAGIDFGAERLVTELEEPGAISATKGCYVGQEVVARTSTRGQVRRSRVGLRFDWADRGPASGAEVRTAAGQPAGFVTSAAREPGTRRGLAMGYLSTDPAVREGSLLVVQGSTTTSLDARPWPLWD